MKPRSRKGVVLLQTLVMSVLLSMIAVMVMKWVLARYVLAARNYRAAEARAHSDYIIGNRFPAWNVGTIPSDPATTIDGKTVSYTRSGNTFTITVSQD